MLRNDGIGGYPRQFRYLTDPAAIAEEPTPGRPPLPKRTPGDNHVDTQEMKRRAMAHMPGRTAGCAYCGRVYCRIFRDALAYLDRHDGRAARRIRTMLTYHGYEPPEIVPADPDGPAGAQA